MFDDINQTHDEENHTDGTVRSNYYHGMNQSGVDLGSEFLPKKRTTRKKPKTKYANNPFLVYSIYFTNRKLIPILTRVPYTLSLNRKPASEQPAARAKTETMGEELLRKPKQPSTWRLVRHSWRLQILPLVPSWVARNLA